MNEKSLKQKFDVNLRPKIFDMKKLTLTLLLLALFSCAHSQRFIGSIIAGVNDSQVDGDEVAGYYKWGFNGGLSVMMPLDNKFHWFGTIELLYNQKGSFQNAYRANATLSENTPLLWHNEDFSVPFNKKIKYKLTLDYVEVPVLFHYEDWRSGCSIGAGFAWGRLVRVHEIENGWTTTTDLRSGMYKTNDWSVIADAKIRLWKGLKLNVRFQYSMVPFRTRMYDPFGPNKEVRKQYNNVISVRLIYSFNEKFVSNPDYVRGGRKGPRWIHDTSTGWYRN